MATLIGKSRRLGRHLAYSVARVAFLVCTLTSNAQKPVFTPAPSVANTPTIIEDGSSSDQAAVSLFKRALDSSGGVGAWTALRSAKERFSVPGTTQKQTLLLDDWSSASVRYRRGVVGNVVTPINHDSQNSFTVQLGKKTLTIHEFDQGHVLADHLPSASIALMLRSPSYLFKMVPANQCTVQNQCVDVYRRMTAKGPFEKDQEWELSDSSSLPTSVKLRLPDVLRGNRQIWESVSFTSYTTKNSYLIPTSITARMAAGAIQYRTVVDFQPNILFDTVAFDKEIAQ